MMTDEQYSDDFDNNISGTAEKLGNQKFSEITRISKLEKSKLPILINNQKDSLSAGQKITSASNNLGNFPSETSNKLKNN